MFSSLQAFISRHRRKFIIGSVFIGGAFLLSEYAKKVLKDRQEKETRELLERNVKEQHYETITTLCDKTALSMAPTLKGRIINLLKTDELINRLKAGASDKISTWEELKILTFTKVVLWVCASSFLMVTLRIQLNLIGGYVFRDTKDSEKKINNSIEEKYMQICQYFIQVGVVKLFNIIKEKVHLVLHDKSLKYKMTVFDFERLFWAICTSFVEDNRDPCKTLPDFILPESYRKEACPHNDNKVLLQIMKETQDLLECSEVQYLTRDSCYRGFSFVVEKLKNYYSEKNNGKSNKSNEDNVKIGISVPEPLNSATSKSDSKPQFHSSNHLEEASDCKNIYIPLAKMIPVIDSFVQFGNNDLTMQWMQELIQREELKVLGANIYETFSSKW